MRRFKSLQELSKQMRRDLNPLWNKSSKLNLRRKWMPRGSWVSSRPELSIPYSLRGKLQGQNQARRRRFRTVAWLTAVAPLAGQRLRLVDFRRLPCNLTTTVTSKQRSHLIWKISRMPRLRFNKWYSLLREQKEILKLRTSERWEGNDSIWLLSWKMIEKRWINYLMTVSILIAINSLNPL